MCSSTGCSPSVTGMHVGTAVAVLPSILPTWTNPAIGTSAHLRHGSLTSVRRARPGSGGSRAQRSVLPGRLQEQPSSRARATLRRPSEYVACWAWSLRGHQLLPLQLELLPLQLELLPLQLWLTLPLLGSGSQTCLQRAQLKLLLSLLTAQRMMARLRGRAVPRQSRHPAGSASTFPWQQGIKSLQGWQTAAMTSLQSCSISSCRPSLRGALPTSRAAQLLRPRQRTSFHGGSLLAACPSTMRCALYLLSCWSQAGSSLVPGNGHLKQKQC